MSTSKVFVPTQIETNEPNSLNVQKSRVPAVGIILIGEPEPLKTLNLMREHNIAHILSHSWPQDWAGEYLHLGVDSYLSFATIRGEDDLGCPEGNGSLQFTRFLALDDLRNHIEV